MKPWRPHLGFTLIEIVIALLIGSILTSIALASFGNASGRFAARGARDTYAAMHARARAMAIERGERIRIYVIPDYDWIVITTDTPTWPYLESVYFDDRYDVDVQGTWARTCMNPRGYADAYPDCTSYSSPLTQQFVVNADSSEVTLLPLGQIIY